MFFSDLDRTIIYSTRFIDPPMPFLVTPVESLKGRHISHMTLDSYESLQELRSRIEFVPVTARTIDEVLRISFIHKDIPTWMVCENGKVIYHKGKRLREWDDLVGNKLLQQQKDLNEATKTFLYLAKVHGVTLNTLNEFAFLFKTENGSERFIEDLQKKKEWFREYGCRLYNSGRKVYFMPSILNKGNAVRYLIQTLKPEKTVGAGDSTMDISFLKEVTYPVAPQHHTIPQCPYPVTSQTGMKAGEQIIQYAMMKLCR